MVWMSRICRYASLAYGIPQGEYNSMNQFIRKFVEQFPVVSVSELFGRKFPLIWNYYAEGIENNCGHKHTRMVLLHKAAL